MNRRVYARVDNGLESLMRVVSVLRRKRFNVKGVNMEHVTNTNFANLIVEFEDKGNFGIEKAINHIEKLIDVYEVRELV